MPRGNHADGAGEPFRPVSQKGEIASGSDADLVLWDPEARHTISAATHRMRVDYSQFEDSWVEGNARTGSRVVK